MCEPIGLGCLHSGTVVNLLVRLRDLGLTYLFIAHDLSMVRHISDRTAVVFGHPGWWRSIGSTIIGHPYTKGLLSAVPMADPRHERSRVKVVLGGEVPSPVNPKPGCRFRSRCSLRSVCSERIPELNDVGEDISSCHNV